MPPASAPLPIGVTTVPGVTGDWSRISSAIAPYASYWSGSAPSSKNGSPASAAYARATSLASSRSAPATRTSAPSSPSSASLRSAAPGGTKTTAATPSWRQAQATAAPWLPVEDVTTALVAGADERRDDRERRSPLERAELVDVLTLEPEALRPGVARERVGRGLERRHAQNVRHGLEEDRRRRRRAVEVDPFALGMRAVACRAEDDGRDAGGGEERSVRPERDADDRRASPEIRSALPASAPTIAEFRAVSSGSRANVAVTRASPATARSSATTDSTDSPGRVLRSTFTTHRSG